jgi:hypothetical protein
VIELELVLAVWRPTAAASMHAMRGKERQLTMDNWRFPSADGVLAIGVG